MNATETWSYLTDVEYPATKLDVIAIAEAAGAPQPVIELLQSLGHERFDSPEALQMAIRASLRSESTHVADAPSSARPA